MRCDRSRQHRAARYVRLPAQARQAARVIPLERLALSPQCGFASTWQGNRITPEVQREKLAVVAETARKVWARSPR